MKFVFPVFASILLVGLVAAQANSGVDEALEKRAQALLDSTKKELEEHRAAGRGHLLSAVEHEVVLVEALVLDLKQNAGKAEHHRHVIEEDLLHLENRISEELSIIRNFDHQPRNHTATNLLMQADTLVHAAREVLRIEPNVKEAKVLNSEIVEIEKLIKDIRAKPNATELRKEEEQLARHEQSLRQILERISRRNHAANPNGQPIA